MYVLGSTFFVALAAINAPTIVPLQHVLYNIFDHAFYPSYEYLAALADVSVLGMTVLFMYSAVCAMFPAVVQVGTKRLQIALILFLYFVAQTVGYTRYEKYPLFFLGIAAMFIGALEYLANPGRSTLVFPLSPKAQDNSITNGGEVGAEASTTILCCSSNSSADDEAEGLVCSAASAAAVAGPIIPFFSSRNIVLEVVCFLICHGLLVNVGETLMYATRTLFISPHDWRMILAYVVFAYVMCVGPFWRSRRFLSMHRARLVGPLACGALAITSWFIGKLAVYVGYQHAVLLISASYVIGSCALDAFVERIAEMNGSAAAQPASDYVSLV